jgi:hypothetical protein
MTGQGDEPATTAGLQYPMVEFVHGRHDLAADVRECSGDLLPVIAHSIRWHSCRHGLMRLRLPTAPMRKSLKPKGILKRAHQYRVIAERLQFPP